ncbi:hypothetical protein Q5H91_03690 [Sphingomonas sp. KR1UV-12]|uniref:DUF2188 domain-containing protein n=1 Tax=Sphingomonas aurea TaxID=3063994 RepID=A0ABT9EI52_9SPHN|nr:hypothetical protein [Sphingomonas sp. KR1UV-12]MDP1026303.1 hypothetical protein [Sphingomonas sp. KR1UV-12]
MTALVYAAPAWHRARARRAADGRAPRLAVTRAIALRETASGNWLVMVYTRRCGVWSKPERLCRPCSFEEARAVAVTAWRRYRLPIVRVLHADGKMRPIQLDQSDVVEARACRVSAAGEDQ